METLPIRNATEPARQPRQRIVAAAQALYMHQGIQAVRMDDVANHLRMSKKTIYKWFGSKPALVHAALDAYTCQMRVEFGLQNERSTTAVEELLAFRDWVQRETGQVRALMFWELEQFYGATWQLWQNHCNGYLLNHVRNNLRWGILQGLYHDHLDVEFLARLWLREISTGLGPAPPDMLGLDLHDVRRTLLEHFMAGIVTPAGAFVARRLQESLPVY